MDSTKWYVFAHAEFPDGPHSFWETGRIVDGLRYDYPSCQRSKFLVKQLEMITSKHVSDLGFDAR